MPRKVTERIYVGTPPTTCDQCRLCGHRPQVDLTPGSRWTMKCMLDDHLISGRGSHQEKACRCNVKRWRKIYWPQDGWYTIGIMTALRYKIRLTDQLLIQF